MEGRQGGRKKKKKATRNLWEDFDIIKTITNISAGRKEGLILPLFILRAAGILKRKEKRVQSATMGQDHKRTVLFESQIALTQLMLPHF